MRSTVTALLSVTPRPLSGLFFAAALFSASCTTSGLQPYTDDGGRDTAATTDDTGSDETGGDDTEVDSGSGTTDSDEGGCPTGEVEDCTGSCLPEEWLGDGLCQSRFDCAANNYDDGDCLEDPDTDTGTGGGGTGGGCPSGQIEDCSGVCANRNLLGNGTCDMRFDCSAHAYDDGDCQDTGGGGGTGGCAAGEIEDCVGGCVPDWWPGDGYCDVELDCAAHAFDDGDCEDTGGGGTGGTTCPSGYIVGCDGVTCVLATWLGDLYCDADLECSGTGWDDGDCLNCFPDEVIDCQGGCTPASWWDDGICDSGLDCATWGNDGDDCSGGGGTSACPSGYVEGCDGVCVPASWVGDLYCDADLECGATNWDDGDCLYCWPDEVIDCDGGCTPASWIGDLYCDLELYCSTWAYDYGDCD